MKINRFPFVFALCLTLLSCGGEEEPESSNEKWEIAETDTIPTNVVVFMIPGLDYEVFSLLRQDPNANIIQRMNNVGFYAPQSYFEPYSDLNSNMTALMTGKTTMPGMLGIDKDSVQQKTWIRNFMEQGYSVSLLTGGLLIDPVIHGIFPGSYVNSSLEENLTYNLVSAKPDFIWGIGRNYFDRRRDRVNLFDQMNVSDYQLNFDITDPKYAGKERYAGIFYYYNAPDTVDVLSIGLEQWNKFKNRKSNPYLLIVVVNSVQDLLNSQKQQNLLELNKALDQAASFLDLQSENTLMLLVNPFQDYTRSISPVVNDSVISTSTPNLYNQRFNPIWAFGDKADQFRGNYNNTDFHKKMLRILE